MSPTMSVIASAAMVFLAAALASEWAARRLVARIDERLCETRRDAQDGE